MREIQIKDIHRREDNIPAQSLSTTTLEYLLKYFEGLEQVLENGKWSYLDTGDDLEIFVRGFDKDVIKSFNNYPRLKSLLYLTCYTHPGSINVALIPVPSEKYKKKLYPKEHIWS